MSRTCLTVVLAAGEGTRMQSALPKVLHRIAGRSLVGHVLACAHAAGGTGVAVVVGPDRDDVAREARAVVPGARVFVQRERLGTAHAVLAAREAIAQGFDDVLVVYGDTPLIRPGTLAALREPLAAGAAVVALGFRPDDPAGYGRLIVEGDDLLAVREEKDATAAERAVRLCNAGLMALDGQRALAILEAIGDINAKREFYLTDAVEIARARGWRVAWRETDAAEVAGVNTRGQLAEAEAIIQRRLREAAMAAGVTLVAPDTVFLSADTRLGRDVVVEPNVVFGPGVTVGDNVEIKAFSHLEGATVAAGARIGPYARLRPGAVIGEDAHIGNFVEIKATVVERGAKANHLAYIGDARIGAGANVGAGTITCNYDGFGKWKTDIGAGVFVGSNATLVAPVAIGDGGYVGAGSVITDDVPGDALAIGRGRQVTKDGRAAELRARFAARKASKAT